MGKGWLFQKYEDIVHNFTQGQHNQIDFDLKLFTNLKKNEYNAVIPFDIKPIQISRPYISLIVITMETLENSCEILLSEKHM